MPETTTLAINRAAVIDRRPLGAASWVEVISGWAVDPVGAFAQVHTSSPWEQTEVLRYDKYVPERRLGAGLRCEAMPLLRQTELHLESRFRQRFTGVAAILYRSGDDFQGLHSDREMRWLDDTLIAILVLGQRRPFVLRERSPGPAHLADRSPAGSLPGDIVLTPGEGDLLIMGGACQRDWLHGVPPDGTESPRISLTWRWSSRRGRPDTNAGYYDGRQFSDGPRQPGYRRSS